MLKDWAAEAYAALAARSKEGRREVALTWRIWVDEQLKQGAGALHRFTKRSLPVPNEAVEANQRVMFDGSPHTGLSTGLDDVLKKAREEWAIVWQRFRGVAGAPWRTCPAYIITRSAPLPPLTVEALREAARTFKKRTGIGADHGHPRAFDWLSDEVLEGLAALLEAIEETGVWPQQVSTISIALIPKSGGGRRPIGILPGLVRLWERARRPIIQKWRMRVQRSYNWAAKGKSPQDAVWLQALKAEAAAARGLASAAGHLDLVKASEMVQLELVWHRGLEPGFPVTILRATLETFSFARRLMLDGAVSEHVHTLSAIPCGRRICH